MADDLTDLEAIMKFNQFGNGASIPMNLSRQRGNDLTNNNQILLDRSALTPYEFLRKYGAETTEEVNKLDLGIPELINKQEDDREFGTLAYDGLMQIGKGLNNALGGTAVTAARVVHPQLGSAAATLLGEYNEFTDSRLSTDLQDAKSIDALRANLDKQDNQNQYAEDVKTDGEFTAGLKSIGRDFIQAG